MFWGIDNIPQDIPEYSHIRIECGEYFVEYCQSHKNIVIHLNNVNMLFKVYIVLWYFTFHDVSRELYINNISGQIPSQLGNLASLVNLDLYQNSLSGTIPATLSNCTQLQILYV